MGEVLSFRSPDHPIYRSPDTTPPSPPLPQLGFQRAYTNQSRGCPTSFVFLRVLCGKRFGSVGAFAPTPCPPASTQFHPRSPNPPKNWQRVAILGQPPNTNNQVPGFIR